MPDRSRPPWRFAHRCRDLTILLVVFATVAARAAEAPPAPVLVELFTSQGCSTCPAADRLLGRLGEVGFERVVPLAFHVDYWDRLGWRDPFSDPAWSRRHERYAEALGVAVYTPLMVVGGRKVVTATDVEGLRAAVEAIAAEPAPRVDLALAPRDARIGVEATVALPATWSERRVDVLAVVFELDLVTEVARGENGGRRLENDFVVREVVPLGHLDGSAAEGAAFRGRLRLDDGWRRNRLGVAVFLQDPDDRAVLAAAARLLEAGAERVEGSR